ncbi:UNVERIFIED_CONTAM: hypothetical protein HDU68_009459 [Siphonaria sp. JEL0065]|nr:hypothetical protein HDU68_009459 [Siphonaria sp. JEL0065]
MKRSIDDTDDDHGLTLGAGLSTPSEAVPDGGFVGIGLDGDLGSLDSNMASDAKRPRLDNDDDTDNLDNLDNTQLDVKDQLLQAGVGTPPISNSDNNLDNDEDDLDADNNITSDQLIEPLMPLPSQPVHHIPQQEQPPQPVVGIVQQQPVQQQIQYESTPLDKFQLKFCNRILGRAKRLKDAFMFLQPVDPIKLGIPTYFHFIKRPMDLSTIQKKLDQSVYKTAHDFIDDVTLMFDNCYTFNGRESAVGLIAQNFQRYFVQQLEKMPAQLEVEKKRPSYSGAAATAHPYAAHSHHIPAPIERPKREVQPPPRDNLSPARRPVSKQALAELKVAGTLVRDLMKQKYYAFSYPFLTPVDYIKLNIPTYPLIIKHPMDFGTILKKLDGNLYTSGHEFESDAKLVFKNCYTFNAPGSEVYEMGRKLEQVFDLKWRERPAVAPSSRKSGLAGGADDSDESSSEEEQDLNKMQENLLKLMQEVTKLAAHKGSKKKEKHKKHKMHALLQQQALVASMAGAAAASSSSISSSAPSKKKKSSSNSHSRPRAPAAAPIREITYQQKKELSEKIEDLSPDKLEGVYQIIRSGLPSLDTQAAGQEEIELDIDSLDRVTLSRLYHFVINAARPTSAPPAQPKSLSHTVATNGASSSDSDDSSGSDSDSGSDSSSSSSDGKSSDSSFGGGELVSPEVVPTASAAVPIPIASSSSSLSTSNNSATLPAPVIPVPIPVPVAAPAPVAAPSARGKAGSAMALARGASNVGAGAAKASAAGGWSSSGASGSANTVGGGDIPGITKKTEVKFRKGDPSKSLTVGSVAVRRPPPPLAASAPPKSVDVFNYIDQLDEKRKKEDMEKAKRTKELEEKKSADRKEQDRRQQQQQHHQRQQQAAAAAATLAVKPPPPPHGPAHPHGPHNQLPHPFVPLTDAQLVEAMKDIPSEAERKKKYEESVEKYAGTWMDLSRQGITMQDFEETLRLETSAKYEVLLAKERQEKKMNKTRLIQRIAVNLRPFTTSPSSNATPQPELTPAQMKAIKRMLRVDQAGELAADAIYRGQLAALPDSSPMKPLIKHMHQQEKHHLEILNTLCRNNRVRPSVLSPIWSVAGFALGAGTALLGEKTAMMCTEVVETVIGTHYNDQIRELVKIPENENTKDLAQVIKVLRDEELEHLTAAVENDAKQAPLYDPLSFIITNGCKTAIWIASRF